MNRKIFLFILLPAVLIIGAYVFIRYSLKAGSAPNEEKIAKEANATDSSLSNNSALDLRPLLIKRLQSLVSASSNDVYELSVGDMEIDLLASTVNFEKVALKPNRQRADSLHRLGLAPAETMSFSFENLQVEGINVDDALNSKKMDYKLVRLTNPVIEIYRKAGSKKEPAPKEDFTQRFLKEMEKLSVQNLVVTGGTIIVHNGAKKNVLKEVSINMNNILIDSATRTDETRFFFAKKASLGFKNYTATTGNGQYKLAIATVNVEAPAETVTLGGFTLAPTLGRQEFASSQKMAKEYYKVAFPSVTLSGVDWWTLLNEEEMVAREVNIPGGDVSIYLDRTKAPPNKMGNFPAQLLMKLPLKIDVQRMTMRNLDLAYEEFNPISQQSGVLHIKDIAMTVANVSNMKVKGAKPVTVNGKAMFMGTVPIQADFVFSRENYKAGSFTANIKTNKAFEGSTVNSFAMPMGLVKIDKGTIQELHADIKGDQLRASGNIKILYNDLKLEMLEKDKGEKELDRKGVTSFVAGIILKKDNPKKGEAPRIAASEFTRIPEGGFFMLIWKTIMVGLLKTVGAPTKVASKTVKRPQ